MYTDYYLKFNSEEESKTILYTEQPTEYDEEGNVTETFLKPNYLNIDVLGVLYENQEIIDPENPPELVPIDGWHVNVRVMNGENSEVLESYKVNPEPLMWRRVWG